MGRGHGPQAASLRRVPGRRTGADTFNCGPNPMSKRAMCGDDVSGTIKRSDVGMKHGIPAVADEVRLSIAVEGCRQQRSHPPRAACAAGGAGARL